MRVWIYRNVTILLGNHVMILEHVLYSRWRRFPMFQSWWCEPSFETECFHIKQQQLEPYCNWYYFFLCSILGLLSLISNDSEMNNQFHESTLCEFLPFDLLKTLLFFKFKHSIKFRATWLWISGNMTLVSGEMTFERLDRKPTKESVSTLITISSVLHSHRRSIFQ